MHKNDLPQHTPTQRVDLNLWGKSAGLPAGIQYPLACHLLDAGAAAEVLWRDHVARGIQEAVAAGLGTDVDRAGALVSYWAALHDLGKITDAFQAQDPTVRLPHYPSSPYQKKHDQVAAEWLQFTLPGHGYETESASASAPMVAQILGGHHGQFRGLAQVSSSSPLAALGYPDDLWEAQRRQHFSLITELFAPPPPPHRVDGPTAALVCALVIQADWLVSQLGFVRRQLPAVPSSPAHLARHLQRARSLVPGLLRDAGLARPNTRRGTFTDAFPQIERPNGLQRSLATHLPGLCHGPGLLLVTAPMGEGKTEAALFAAEVMGRAADRHGLYVALPTMATADQMYGRVNDYLTRRVDARASMTLLHGMAWLNPAYLPENEAGETETAATTPPPLPDGDLSSPECQRLVEVTQWLLGRKRGLFADYAVGTIDQALMAALRTRHNVVRMLGLSGKTLIIDEVHAADAYMLALVTRLLAWLGRLQVPVILLSATLHHQTGTTLMDAYLRGAGRRRRGASPLPAVPYPGWVYADARHPHPVTSNPEPLDTIPRAPLTITLREVALDTPTDGGAAGTPATSASPATNTPGETPADLAIQDELAALVEHGGCAAVIRTTVAQAQDTVSRITDWAARHARAAGSTPPEVHLLHARFPARERERITERVVGMFGKDGARDGRRPTGAGTILVATPIIEQSLDLDLDLLISDLAPMHLLLQRAGRCWRHEHLGVITRPAWTAGPRVVVLAPERAGEEKLLPGAWRFIYHPSLLIRTHNLLRRWEGRPIGIPDDIQDLVDGLFDDADLNPDNPDRDLDRWAEDMAHRQLGDNAAIPMPGKLGGDLHRLTDRDIDEEQVTTRFGADSARIVCCYVDSDGGRWLDTDRRHRLPTEGSGKEGAFTLAEVRSLLALSIPVPGRWLSGHEQATEPPTPWTTNVHLRPLRVLSQRLSPDGTVHGTELGQRRLRLDDRLGLVIERGDVP